MLLVPGFLYMRFVLPRYVHPDEPAATSLKTDGEFGCFAASQIVLGCVIMLSFLLASFTNPGIVPRELGRPKELEDPRFLNVHGQPNARFLLINGVTVKQKYCNTCEI